MGRLRIVQLPAGHLSSEPGRAGERGVLSETGNRDKEKLA
jgi:hypothetical protein